MSKICQITGKKAQLGCNVSHSKHRTKRSFDVNLFSKKFYYVEAVGGDDRFAHPAVAGMELTQDVVQHRAVVKLHLGVFGHHAVVAGKRGAKGAQALATGIHRAQRFAEKQDGLVPVHQSLVLPGQYGCLLHEPEETCLQVRAMQCVHQTVLQRSAAFLPV